MLEQIQNVLVTPLIVNDGANPMATNQYSIDKLEFDKTAR